MKIFVLTLLCTFAVFFDSVHLSSQSGTGGSSSSSFASTASDGHPIPTLFQGYMFKPTHRFPAGLLKVRPAKTPSQLVAVPENVPYITLSNLNADVFGNYDTHGYFQRFYDYHTGKQVSINMRDSFKKSFPIRKLDAAEIAYLEHKFGAATATVPFMFQDGIEYPEHSFPPKTVLVLKNKGSTGVLEEVPANVVYKTLGNKHSEVFGIYDHNNHGIFHTFYNPKTRKPAAIDMEYEEPNGVRYGRDLQENEILYIKKLTQQ